MSLETEAPTRRQWSATSGRTGKPCQRPPIVGSEPPVCPMHATGQAALTDELAARLVQLVKAGNYLETAATSCGVEPPVLLRWLALGHDPSSQGRFRRLREQVDAARADAEARNVAIIATAARDHWQAAAWLLERQYPDKWARASQRDKSAKASETQTQSDGFGEVDELATRRRHA
jgi:transposase